MKPRSPCSTRTRRKIRRTRARGVIALQGGELHRLHALRARSAPTGASTSRATRSSARPGAKAASPRSVSVLDRFDIDYALCMYCGICVEVCPFDALFWSPEFEYSEPRIAEAAPRQGPARRVDGDRARARALERVGAEGAEVRCDSDDVAARDRGERLLRDHRGRDGDLGARRRARPRTSCTPRCSWWSCSPAGPRSSSCSAGVRRLGAGARLHRRRRSCCSCSASCSPARRCTPRRRSTTTSRWPGAAAALFLAGILGGLLVHTFHGVEAAHPTRRSAPPTSRNSIFRIYIIPFEVVASCCSPRSSAPSSCARRD